MNVNSRAHVFDMTDLQHAAALVHRVVPPTPQYAWPKLKARAGCTVWVRDFSRCRAASRRRRN
jgi:threonine dehydratase